MSVFRVEKTKDYTVMSNYHLRDKNLTLKAKGLLSWMLSNNDDWDYTVAGIVANVKESRDAVNSALAELEDYGYLRREQKRDGGKFGDIDYVISEKPFTENPLSVNPTTENPQQRNTNITNTKEKKKSIPKGIEGQALKKSYKDVYSALENIKIKDALVKFVNSCKGKRYNPKVETVEKFASDLREYSSNDPELAMRIVDYCIAQGWKAIYPPKDKALLQAVSVNKKQTYATDGDGNLLVF